MEVTKLVSHCLRSPKASAMEILTLEVYTMKNVRAKNNISASAEKTNDNRFIVPHLWKE